MPADFSLDAKSDCTFQLHSLTDVAAPNAASDKFSLEGSVSLLLLFLLFLLFLSLKTPVSVSLLLLFLLFLLFLRQE